MIWFLLLLIVLIATGAFWLVLKIALGVALGVFLGILAITAFVMWRVRKAMTPPKGTDGPERLLPDHDRLPSRRPPRLTGRVPFPPVSRDRRRP